MAYSVYSYGSHYVDGGQVGIYVGTREENLRECLEVIGAELRDVGAGNLRNGELERAKENMKGRLLLSLESTSARMSRLGKAVVTGTEILPIAEIERKHRCRHRGRCRITRPRALIRRRVPLGRRDRAEREALSGCRETAQPRGRGARGMNVLVFGREGKVGAVSMHSLAAAGHDVRGVEVGEPVDLEGIDAAVDFTTPTAVLGNALADARGRGSLRDRHHRTRRRRSRAARSARTGVEHSVLRCGELRSRCRAR